MNYFSLQIEVHLGRLFCWSAVEADCSKLLWMQVIVVQGIRAFRLQKEPQAYGRWARAFSAQSNTIRIKSEGSEGCRQQRHCRFPCAAAVISCTGVASLNWFQCWRWCMPAGWMM